MGFKGACFTWCNQRYEQGWVYVRLDRGVANQEWYDLFPHFDVHHLASQILITWPLGCD